MNILKQNYIKYGLIMGALVALCLFFMEVTGQNQSFDQKNPFIMFFMIIAPFFILWKGIKSRKDQQKNKLAFKEGVAEGFKISGVFAIVSPLVFLFYYQFINPQIVESIKVMYSMAEYSNTQVIVTDMVGQVVSAIFFGTLYSAVVSFLLKSK